MGIFDMTRREKQATDTTREALKEVSGSGSNAERALERMVGAFRDIGLDGRSTFSSAETVAQRALSEAGNREEAIESVIAKHRRGTTAGGFLTGLGGFATLPLLLPTNVFEFYVQATRMVGAIAKLRGYDVKDEEVRARVLAALVAEEQGEILDHVGLGPIAGAATKQVAKRLPKAQLSEVSKAIGVRLLKRFGLRSVRLFGKAIPGLGGVIGAFSDRRQLSKIAKSALKAFPQKKGRKVKN